jgi:protein-tyrosine phosphatase
MSPSTDSSPRILFVCTANICRSPMAAALLSRRLERRAVNAEVLSAGLSEGGREVSDGTMRVLGERGIDVRDHRSYRVDQALTVEADLVLTMEHWHVQEIAVFAPDAWPRTFTLRELVRRGMKIGPRRTDESVPEWVTRAHSGRRPQDLTGAWSDDIDDPYGRSDRTFRRTASELDDLLRQLVSLVWPDRDADRMESEEAERGW